MSNVDVIKKLCGEKGISIARLERDCGFSNGYIKKLKRGTLPADKAQRVADYLGVDIDVLNGVQTNVQHYTDTETARIAQELLSDPARRALLEASADCPPEYIQIASDLLLKLKETNPDG